MCSSKDKGLVSMQRTGSVKPFFGWPTSTMARIPFVCFSQCTDPRRRIASVILPYD